MTGTSTKSTKSATPRRAKRPSEDPRIEARRREVARAEGRKRLRLLIVLSAITLLSIGALAALQSSWLDIDEVVVVGGERTSPDEVRAASGIVVGTPLVDLDQQAAVEGIAALPWVATATVDRSWDGTITATITERTAAIALPRQGGGFMLIDAAGRQLGPVDARPEWAHIINGIEANGVAGQPAPTQVHGVIRLLTLLTDDQLAGITAITVNGDNFLLELAIGGVVDLGNDSGLADKLISYDTLRASVDLRCLHRIDLRVHAAPAITRISATGETGRALSDMVNCT